MRRGTTLVVRLDSLGDVLLCGPAVRAVAGGSERVVMLCGPRGAAAARLLPGIDDVIEWSCPWVVADPARVDATDVQDVVRRIGGLHADAAVIFTSYHQSPLPTALLLRLAGVPHITAASDDYPGTLLDVRHLLPEQGLHEVERMLSTAWAAGFALPRGDRGLLGVRRPLSRVVECVGRNPYVVVHPGASVPARAWSPRHHAELVARLSEDWTVVVTGGKDERALTTSVAGDHGIDLGGALGVRELAAVLDAAEVVVTGNTGPAHLAAAVGTPVVSLFSPVVPVERWRPYGVPTVVLGDQQAACAGSRARQCPVAGHPCLDDVPVAAVVGAVHELATTRQRTTAEVS